jgi:hypothetical protein
MAFGLLLGVPYELVYNVILPIFLNEIEQEEKHMRVATNMKLVCQDWGLEFANWEEWKEVKAKQSYAYEDKEEDDNPSGHKWVDNGGCVFVTPHTFYKRFKGN